MSSRRRAERRTRLVEKYFEDFVKTAVTEDDMDLAITSLKCIKTLKCILQNIREMKKHRKDVTKTHLCPICLDDLKTSVVVLHCGHVFHQQCQENWSAINRTCAVCRCDIQLPPYHLCDDCAAEVLKMHHDVAQKCILDAYTFSCSC